MIPILADIVVILALASVVLVVCHWLRVPTIIGLLFAGVLIGPHGLGVMGATHEVETMAEIGVVLLLFTIGLEISFDSLWQMRRLALGGGMFQILATTLAGFGAFILAGNSVGASVFVGFFIALSSTAVVLKLLQDRGETDSPHGRAILGMLLLQDFMVVPMMLLIPALAGSMAGFSGSVGGQLFKSSVVLGILIASRWTVPWILHQVVRTGNREVFALSIIVICLGIAWLTQAINLSIALGAFLAGLIISESEYSHDALAIVLPFRHVFSSIFFISVGMLVNVRFALDNWHLLILMVMGVVLIKGAIAVLAVALLRHPVRTAILTGVAIAQVGEFSFLLLQRASGYSLISEDTYQLLLTTALITLAATPFLMMIAPRLAAFTIRRVSTSVRTGDRTKAQGWRRSSDEIADHLIIVGYGVGGQNLARAAKSCGIPYVIMEMNWQTVRAMGRKGEPIHYGDAVNETGLLACGVTTARVMVVAISDPAATRRVITTAKTLNPALHLIVRTRYIKELPSLLELGADQVIPEEFETSVEIFTRVLSRYLVPRSDIESVVSEIRSEGYQMLRTPEPMAFSVRGAELALPDMEIGTFRVEPDAEIGGSTLKDLDLRHRYQVTVLALRRDQGLVTNPAGSERLGPGDVVVMMGTPGALALAAGVFVGPKESNS